MKTIVFIETRSGTQKHSAWDSTNEAKQQIKVLKDYGYKNSHYDVIDHNYSNGQYFV